MDPDQPAQESKRTSFPNPGPSPELARIACSLSAVRPHEALAEVENSPSPPPPDPPLGPPEKVKPGEEVTDEVCID